MVLFRQLQPEAAGQVLQVLPVEIVELRIHVPANLELRRDAGNLDAADRAYSDEAVAWPAVGRPAGLLRLPAVAVFVELEWMRVDPAPGRIGEDEAGRPFDVRAHELVEHVADRFDVFGAHAEVEVVVRARLLSEQRVDAPAALEPEVDARRAQAFDDVDDVLRGQLYCACARSSPSASSVSTASAARLTSVSTSSAGAKFESR